MKFIRVQEELESSKLKRFWNSRGQSLVGENMVGVLMWIIFIIIAITAIVLVVKSFF